MSDIFDKFRTDEDLIKSMSRDEKKEFIRKLIHEEQSDTKAAFFNPKTHEMINLQDYVRHVGEEEAIEKIADIIGETDVKSICVTQEQMHELIEKLRRGECSEDEIDILKMIESSIASSDNSQFILNSMSFLVEITKFAQNKIHYNPTLLDLFSIFDLLTTVDMINDPKFELAKYKQGGPNMLSTMADNIGDDIIKTWKLSCQSIPSDDMIILGLMSAIKKLLVKNNSELIDAGILSNLMDLDSFGDSDEDEEKNGSNTEGEDKRNLLKH